MVEANGVGINEHKVDNEGVDFIHLSNAEVSSRTQLSKITIEPILRIFPHKVVPIAEGALAATNLLGHLLDGGQYFESIP